MAQEIETLRLPASTLVKAVAGAAVGAAVILTLFVWPAETGYDPTGVGEKLGLTGMSAANAEEGSQAAAPSAGAQIMSKETIAKTTAYRTDEKSFTLAPHSGIEIKAHMAKGDSFVFHWEAQGGPVKMDMHGEPPNAAEDEFTTYWKEKALTSAQGTFTAGFEGRHGWYWRNKGEVPVTIHLSTSGFYKDLFEPKE